MDVKGIDESPWNSLLPTVIWNLIQEYAKEELDVQHTVMKYVWKLEHANRSLLPRQFQSLANGVYRRFYRHKVARVTILLVRQAIRDLKQKRLIIKKDRLCVNRHVEWTILEPWVRYWELVK